MMVAQASEYTAIAREAFTLYGNISNTMLLTVKFQIIRLALSRKAPSHTYKGVEKLFSFTISQLKTKKRTYLFHS